MFDRLKQLIAALRVICDERSCEECPSYYWCHERKINNLDDEAADMLELLSAELEKTKCERDLAVLDLRRIIVDSCYYCDTCRYAGSTKCMHPSGTICNYDVSNWEWRGLQEE